MGVIYPQAVKMRPSGTNCKYYESLGYHIPTKISKSIRRFGEVVYDTDTKFDVVIDDLFKGSDAFIWYNCDCCGELNYISYNDLNRRNRIGDDGKIYCQKCTAKVKHSGPSHPWWNPNKTDEERIIGRNYTEYKNFIKRVMARDNYTCQVCGQESGNIEVHHLNGYNWDKNHRTDDTNGITLCENCHKRFHAIYGHRDNTKEQFEEWIGYVVKLAEYEGSIYNLPRVYCLEDEIIYDDRFDAAQKLNCHPDTIYNLCAGENYTYHGKHYLYYDNYIRMSEEEIDDLLSKGLNYRSDKRLVCKTTGKLFNSVAAAEHYYNLKSGGNIQHSITRVNGSSGKYKGHRLQWMWYSDYIQLSIQEQIKIARDNEQTLEQGSFLYQLLNENKELNI